MKTKIRVRTHASIVVLIMAMFSAIAVICMTKIAEAQYTLEGIQGKDQEITTTTLGELKLTELEQKKKQVMLDAAKEALSIMKIPETTVDLVFHEEKDERFLTQSMIFLMPKLSAKVTPYMFKIERRVLAEEDNFLRHLTLHHFARIKNGDYIPDQMKEDIGQAEQERRGEITLFRALGREKYIEIWKRRHACEKKQRPQSTESLQSYLDEIQFRLGIVESFTIPPETETGAGTGAGTNPETGPKPKSNQK